MLDDQLRTVCSQSNENTQQLVDAGGERFLIVVSDIACGSRDDESFPGRQECVQEELSVVDAKISIPDAGECWSRSQAGILL